MSLRSVSESGIGTTLNSWRRVENGSVDSQVKSTYWFKSIPGIMIRWEPMLSGRSPIRCNFNFLTSQNTKVSGQSGSKTCQIVRFYSVQAESAKETTIHLMCDIAGWQHRLDFEQAGIRRKSTIKVRSNVISCRHPCGDCVSIYGRCLW